jgi:hypothetical protein
MFATCPSARAISVELFVTEDCRVSTADSVTDCS